MELHRLNDVHPLNRGNLKAAYFAYLQNTPGSKKALKECVSEIGSEKKDEEKVCEDEKEMQSEQEVREEEAVETSE